MKRKMFVICTSIAALHLVVGGAFFLGGCTGVQEDEPMPKGAFIPQDPKTEQKAEAEVQPTSTQQNEPQTTETPKIEDPVVVDEPVVDVPEKTEPAKTAVAEEKKEVKAPQKGDQPKTEPKKTVPVRTEDIVYIVKKKDTYWDIAKKYGVSVKDLETYNGTPAKKLHVGQKLLIPATGKKVTKAAVTAKVRVKKSYEPIPADGIYVVKKNDSFHKIASKFGLRASDIAEYNNLPLTKAIQPNQKLKLPPRRKAPANQPAEKVNEEKAVETPVDEPAEKQPQPVSPVNEDIQPPSGDDIEAPTA